MGAPAPSWKKEERKVGAGSHFFQIRHKITQNNEQKQNIGARKRELAPYSYVFASNFV